MADSREQIVERLIEQGTTGLGARLAHWVHNSSHRKERKLRWRAASNVLHRHHAKAKGLRRRHLYAEQWIWTHKQFLRVRRAIRRHRKPKDEWPADMHITELFNNDNGFHNHVHIASTDRNALIQIEKIAVEKYGGAGMVREFPPFDPVECVHVSVSWHYRDSSSPFTLRDCAHRGDGLAADNGFPQRQAFGDEVKGRYGADRCDF